MKQTILSLTLFLFYFYLMPSVQAQSTVQKAINTLVKDPSLKHANLSVSVIEVSSGRLVASHQANKSLIPASSLKIVTTTTALGVLGESYTFRTELQHDGEISNGVLTGNLYLKGYGDPTLGSSQMEGAADLDNLMLQLTQRVQDAGIQQIKGLVVGDASYFEKAINIPSWQWNDIGNYYGAGAFGLNIHENLYYLRFQQASRLGMTPEVAQISPKIPNLLIMNELTSAGRGTGDNAYIYGAPYTYIRYVRGTIPIGSNVFSIKGSLPDPPFFAAHYLTETLERYGVSTQKTASTQLELEREKAPSLPRKTLFVHHSPRLKDIVKRTNMKSVNLYCENFLKILGAEQRGKGTRKDGLKVIENFWAGKGLNLNGFFIEDGSGLSPRNAVSSYHLAKIMQLAAQDAQIYPAFFESLPVGGVSGSLKRMFKGTHAVGKIRAKSGTLNRVRSFTGYATNKAGEELAFCIIVNNYMGSGAVIRKKLERLMLAIAS